MAGKSKAKPKGSGRKKGTPNKRSLGAKELAEEIGVDPLEVMLRYAKGDWKWFGFKERSLKIGKATIRDHITPEDRFNASVDAAPYLYGKRRFVDEEGNTGMDDLKELMDEIDGTASEKNES